MVLSAAPWWISMASRDWNPSLLSPNVLLYPLHQYFPTMGLQMFMYYPFQISWLAHLVPSGSFSWRTSGDLGLRTIALHHTGFHTEYLGHLICIYCIINLHVIVVSVIKVHVTVECIALSKWRWERGFQFTAVNWISRCSAEFRNTYKTHKVCSFGELPFTHFLNRYFIDHQ